MIPNIRVQVKQTSIERWQQVLCNGVSDAYSKTVQQKIQKLEQEIKDIKKLNPELFF